MLGSAAVHLRGEKIAHLPKSSMLLAEVQPVMAEQQLGRDVLF